jgi:hypothetical protein
MRAITEEVGDSEDGRKSNKGGCGLEARSIRVQGEVDGVAWAGQCRLRTFWSG